MFSSICSILLDRLLTWICFLSRQPNRSRTVDCLNLYLKPAPFFSCAESH
ncbi:hypothetical protein AG1IA_07087 [Rhizoctonia solani AG-1 IA]|uniref:Uncharacterized protein n=1 Tax=Thanatephorus cucumeris (strain AG1-IA) TaxID=983506 RepID=L8WL47_THACA|nr:hypothetical protein AG1IA_07087 [Rhizoctonia solani AG-1 IA]